MSKNFSNEYENSESTHKKLRYFNEMISEIQSLLALEPGDLKATHDAERDVAAQLVRFRSAKDSVAQAHLALEVAEQFQARIAAEMQLATQQACALADALITDVETRPHVRPMYKSGLRDIFSDASSGVQSSDTDSTFVPYALKLSADKNKTALAWQWQGAASNTVCFEVAAAIGSASVYRGTTTATDGQDFVSLGTTEPGAEMRLLFTLEDTPGHALKDGVPVMYRVRTVMRNNACGGWSEPLRVLYTAPHDASESKTASSEKASSGFFGALFDVTTRRARG